MYERIQMCIINMCNLNVRFQSHNSIKTCWKWFTPKHDIYSIQKRFLIRFFALTNNLGSLAFSSGILSNRLPIYYMHPLFCQIWETIKFMFIVDEKMYLVSYIFRLEKFCINREIWESFTNILSRPWNLKAFYETK